VNESPTPAPTPPAAPRKSFPRTLVAAVAIAAVGAGAGVGAYAIADSGSSPAPAAAPVAASTVAPVALKNSTSLISLYKKTEPGVVDITVTTTASNEGFGGFGGGSGSGGSGSGGSSTAKAEGTGIVYDSKGDIVTNEHVVDGATSIVVKFWNGKTAKATLVGADKNNDLAIIKVDPSATSLTPLAFGDSNAVQTGESVFAIGSPFGLTESLSTGVVSATGRQIESPGNTTIANAIQTDAAINHGNSGGPLLDAEGAVIGINAQIESDSGGNDGVGFAIPANTVKKVAASLIAGQKVANPFIGITIEDAPNGGAQIGKITANSPAATAGLQSGDVITAIDSTPVTSVSDLVNAVAADSVGQKVTLTITRGDASQTVDVTLGATSSS
jgi:putative serine protease PepD